VYNVNGRRALNSIPETSVSPLEFPCLHLQLSSRSNDSVYRLSISPLRLYALNLPTLSPFPSSGALVVIVKRFNTLFLSSIFSSLCYLRSHCRHIYSFSTLHTPPYDPITSHIY
jgi:hypothetical protein